MAEGSGAKGAPQSLTDDELAWMGEHLTEIRRSAYGQRLVYQSLGVGFVVGLALQVGGYLLRPSPHGPRVPRPLVRLGLVRTSLVVVSSLG